MTCCHLHDVLFPLVGKYLERYAFSAHTPSTTLWLALALGAGILVSTLAGHSQTTSKDLLSKYRRRQVTGPTTAFLATFRLMERTLNLNVHITECCCSRYDHDLQWPYALALHRVQCARGFL